MKKLLLLGTLVAVLGPVAAQASPPAAASSAAGRVCAGLKASMGANFSQAYATFGACVAAHASLDQGNAASAVASCRTEQADATFAAAHAGKTFDQAYGTNADLSNAFGKCVSQKAKAAAAAQVQATVSAAKACRTELNAGAPAFKQKYGTFGHCVSFKAKIH